MQKQSHANIKAKRVRKAKKQSANNTAERLHAREIVKVSQSQLLKRSLEDA